MEPIGWRRVDKAARVSSPGPHGSAYNIGQVPGLHHAPGSVHLDVYGLVIGYGIRVQNNSHLAAIDVVVEELNSKIAVIANHGDGSIEIDSIELRAMRKIGGVVKEGGTNTREASCAHPPQFPVRIDN